MPSIAVTLDRQAPIHSFYYQIDPVIRDRVLWNDPETARSKPITNLALEWAIESIVGDATVGCAATSGRRQ